MHRRRHRPSCRRWVTTNPPRPQLHKTNIKNSIYRYDGRRTSRWASLRDSCTPGGGTYEPPKTQQELTPKKLTVAIRFCLIFSACFGICTVRPPKGGTRANTRRKPRLSTITWVFPPFIYCCPFSAEMCVCVFRRSINTRDGVVSATPPGYAFDQVHSLSSVFVSKNSYPFRRRKNVETVAVGFSSRRTSHARIGALCVVLLGGAVFYFCYYFWGDVHFFFFWSWNYVCLFVCLFERSHRLQTLNFYLPTWKHTIVVLICTLQVFKA